MPIHFARRLVGSQRTTRNNRLLGLALAFVAGAINAGGFLAVHQYTSHMTGIVSFMADNLALGDYALVGVGIGALVSFIAGAACSAALVHYARQRALTSEYALPLLLEAVLLLGFGGMGAQLAALHGLFVPVTVMLLCFIMGLQNAVVSKLTQSEIRTTHVTGTVTDIGIELGKLLYWNPPGSAGAGRVLADRPRLLRLSGMLAAFFLGGLAGALGFKHLGYVATLPLAALLVLLASVPAVDDLLVWARRLRPERR